jgi:hypothetical protein
VTLIDGAGCGPAGSASSAGSREASGSPSVLTTGDCPQGLDADRMNAGESLRDQGGQMASVRSRKHGPEAQNPAVERRKARRPASWAGGPARDRPDRKAGHGCGDPHRRLSALHPLGFSGRDERTASGRRKKPRDDGACLDDNGANDQHGTRGKRAIPPRNRGRISVLAARARPPMTVGCRTKLRRYSAPASPQPSILSCPT